MIFTDVLFSFSPIIRPYVSSLKMPDHPVTVIYKDQTFFSRFGRDPNRSDFAAIADFLNNSKVNTVVFDYIFDQPSNTEDDKRFSQSLASITFPVLAQHFTSRGSGSFESRTIVDENASRPQPPLPLFSGISDYSAATGLINMAGGFDSTIRFVPLAFLPAESDEFLLTLGYTSWIASLVADKKEDIRAIALDLNESPKIIIEQVLSKGPYRYRTTGHSGVDKATRKLEIQLIKRLLEINELESFDYIETPTTWLNMPESPLPIIGSYEIPCIRLNFTKESFPFSGDGIVTKSMGTLLESEADKLSPLFADKMKLKITDDCDFLSLPILAESKTGKKEIKGKISYYDGSAVSGAEALLLMPSAATWQKTITDTKGNYSFSNLYGGDFLLYLTVRTSNGWISCSTKKYFGSEDVIEMSDVLIPRPVERVCANTEKIASSAEKICVFGEPIILIKTQKDGRTGIYEISDDYELIRYDDGSNVILLSSGEALGEQGAVLKETELAMLPKTNEWVTGFYATEQISYSNKVIEIGGLPTSLDTRLALLGKSATAGGQNTVDAVIMPANQTVIDELPEPTKENSHVAGVKFLSRDKDDYVVRLIDDKFREIVGSTGSLIKLFSGSYFVLLENSKRRIFWQDSQIQTDAVFLGSAAQTDQDFVVTPINFMDMSFTRLPGVNLHANLYSALRRQCFIRPIFFHPDSCRNFWPLIQFLLLSPILIILNQIYTNKGAIIGGISIVICSAL
ncbi:MAG: CHASE2 domain-containing protein, partial [Candidatus Riflebacteria bacterium]|nr:CHASE2 domain-containing protein [Candidatus Riflebacteria bacterium]